MLTEQELFKHAVKFDFETNDGLFSIELRSNDAGTKKWVLCRSDLCWDRKLRGFIPEPDKSNEYFEETRLSFEEAVEAMDSILNRHKIN